ncbi:TonB-dependent siderophore receptor [Campylobacter sp. RM3125]|uniref:TonB-dependent siderophore receptor n=1 Tax=Campylobacter molothri TaxID=1032242 RepID=UPI00301BB2D2|nr:TonB-dependent siderophore receptor [Campylobacter sp. RM3125]MBZ7971920.1 TonB-dependent siderophore receptor [Campylobacter sp. RM3124]
MNKVFNSFLLISISASLALAKESSYELGAVSVVGSIEKGNQSVDYLSPKSVSVISAKQIQEEGAQQLDEITRYESGFVSQIYGADLDTTDWLKLRGFDASLVLDGTAIYKGGYFGWSPDLYGLEKIEVIKGADSLSYGSSQSGGVINLVSKRPQKNPIAEIGSKIGNLSQNGLFFDIGDKAFNTNSNFRIVGNYFRQNGQLDGTWQEHYYFAPSLAINIDDDTFLTLLSSFQYDQGVPTTGFFPVYGTIIDTPQGTIKPSTNLGSPLSDYLKRKQYSLGYEFIHYFNDELTFMQNYRYNMEDKSQFAVSFSALDSKDPTTATRSSIILDGIARSHTLDNRLVLKHNYKELENTLTSGIDYQYIYVNGKYGYGSASNVNIFVPDHTPQIKSKVPTYLVKQSQLGLYVQDRAKLDKWILDLGMRFDKAKSNAKSFGNKSDYNVNHTTFQTGLMYIFEDLGLMPFVSYSGAFRPIAGSDGEGKGYKPYESRQYEAGFKYLPYFIDGELNLSYFDIQEKNALVNADPSMSTPVSIQAGKQNAKGLELSSNMALSESINYTLAYAHYFQTHTSLDALKTIRTPMMPKDIFATKISHTFKIDHKQNFKSSFGIRYIGSSTDEAGNPNIKVPSYTLYDLAFSYNYDKWNARLNIDNIFNKKYVSGCYYSCYYGEGIKGILSISYKY